MKKQVKVALSFATFTNSQLNSFAILVLACLKNNALFPNLPVKLPDLEVLVTTFQQAMAAAAMGGPKDTAAMYDAREALIAALRQTAGYITSLGLTSEADVLSSGFDIVIPGKNPPVPLDQPVVRMDNSIPGRMVVDVQAVPNAKAYYVQYNTGTGTSWTDLGIFPNTRNITIPNTTAGTTYSSRVQAVGGATQYSPWSQVASNMSL